MNAILEKAKLHAHLFRPKFMPWLKDNLNVYITFENRALYKWREGREHYSARTIFEIMRFESSIKDNSEYRLNDHYSPDCARLFMLLHPECGEFFELRGRPLVDECDCDQVDIFGVVA